MLEAKCKVNVNAMQDIIETRLKCLFSYLSNLKKGDYDYKKVKITFSPCIPVDEAQLADIISKLPQDVVSNYTKRSWLPRIDNPKEEQKRINKEKEDEINQLGDNYDGQDEE